jgi:hypothetical protein
VTNLHLGPREGPPSATPSHVQSRSSAAAEPLVVHAPEGRPCVPAPRSCCEATGGMTSAREMNHRSEAMCVERAVGALHTRADGL